MEKNIILLFIFNFVTLQIVICHPLSFTLPQIENPTSIPSQLQPNQLTNTVSESSQRYILNRELPEIVTGEPNLFSQATKTLTAPQQPVDLTANKAKKYEPRGITDIQPPVSAQDAQLPMSNLQNTASKIVYKVRQTVEVPSQPQQQQSTSTGTSLPNVVDQIPAVSTSETFNMDPAVLTQNVYQALEENFGRLGPVLYDLITSPEGLGKDFPSVTAYVAQRLGGENIRNAVNTIMNFLNQVDWRSRIQSLFSRIGTLRDNRTGLTLQDVFQVVRNIFDDPEALSGLRQLIRNGTDLSTTAAANDSNGQKEKLQPSRSYSSRPRSRSYVYY